jgi:exopolysaccharide production protein ExoZ
MTEPYSSMKLQNIQALRFFAAGIVLLTHITFYIKSRLSSSFEIWHPGAAGVSLFFIISGVVIYLSSENIPRNKLGAASFIVRRILRIFPIYWIITTIKLVIVIFLPFILIKNQPDTLYIICSYFLIPILNFAGNIEPLHGVGWSLMHEMYFYYIFSIALIFKISPFIFSSIFITAVCVIGFFSSADSAFEIVYFSEKNLLFVVGMLIAHLRNKIKISQNIAILLFIIGFLFMLSDSIRNIWYPFFRGFDIGAVLIIFSSMSIESFKSNFIFKKLINLGESSYSLYLTHPILAPAICLILWNLNVLSIPFVILFTFFICIAIGHFFYIFVESPITKKSQLLFHSFYKKA